MAVPLKALSSQAAARDIDSFKIPNVFRKNQLLLAIIVKTGSAAAETDEWTLIKSASSDTLHVALFWRIAKQNDPINFEFQSPYADTWGGYIYGINRYSSASPINAAGISLSLNSPNVTTLYDDSLILTGFAVDDADVGLSLGIFQQDFNFTSIGNRDYLSMVGGSVYAPAKGNYGPYQHERAYEGNAISWTLAITSDEFFSAEYEWISEFPFDTSIIDGILLSQGSHHNFNESESYINYLVSKTIDIGGTATQIDDDTWEFTHPDLPSGCATYTWKRTRL